MRTRLLFKYSDDQPRDENGRFGSGGGSTEGKLNALFADNLGYSRDTMPQVPSAMKQQFLDELTASGVSMEAQTVDASTLKATQKDFKTEVVEGMMPVGPNTRSPILVSREGRVVDGHHRWAVAALGNTPINTIRVHMPIKDLLAHAERFTVENDIARHSAKSVNLGCLFKWNEDQPRDENGRFASGGGGGSEGGGGGQTASLSALSPRTEEQRLLGDSLHAEAYKMVADMKQGDSARVLTPEEKATAAEQLAPALKAAAEAKPEFDEKMKALGDDLGAKVMLAPVKGGDRLLQKHIDENGSNPANMWDLVRGSLVVDKMEDVPAALKALNEKFDVERVKDRFAKPLDTGYRDILASVRLPGGIMGEVQIHISEMITAKGGAGHKLYEIQRALPAGHESIPKLMAMQTRIYGAALAAHQGRG